MLISHALVMSLSRCSDVPGGNCEICEQQKLDVLSKAESEGSVEFLPFSTDQMRTGNTRRSRTFQTFHRQQQRSNIMSEPRIID